MDLKRHYSLFSGALIYKLFSYDFCSVIAQDGFKFEIKYWAVYLELCSSRYIWHQNGHGNFTDQTAFHVHFRIVCSRLYHDIF